MFNDDEENNKPRKTIRDILNSMDLDPRERAKQINKIIKSPLYKEGYANGVKETEMRLEMHYKDIIRTMSVIIAENQCMGLGNDD